MNFRKFIVAIILLCARSGYTQTHDSMRYLSLGIEDYNKQHTLRAICVDGLPGTQPCAQLKFVYDDASIGPEFTGNDVLYLLSSEQAISYFEDSESISKKYSKAIRVKYGPGTWLDMIPQFSKMTPKGRANAYVQLINKVYPQGREPPRRLSDQENMYWAQCSDHCAYRTSDDPYGAGYPLASIERTQRKNTYWFIYIPNNDLADFQNYKRTLALLMAKHSLEQSLYATINSSQKRTKPLYTSPETLQTLVLFIKSMQP